MTGSELADYMKAWDRGYIHGAIAEATGVLLSADDAIPDVLIAKAQDLGIEQVDLKAWIYQELPQTITAIRHAALTEALERWARRCQNPAQAACGHCGAAIEDPQQHQCQPKGEQQ